ncbi:MAG: hypothetical protein LBD57_02940 [Endomicrobium sp.]|jgi:hypothetical protein|uniref:hypothetical protein n=1 Tax=Candidatus Endomicrobiellum cubanum TaxID=3242325 RepID=UPI00282C7330|nr:hypothetical protein [Endomicrobium sp.]
MKQTNHLKLLMEETGCEESQAELALNISDNNLEKAISTIGFLLKFIKIFKIKLIFPKENVYGLVQIAVNMKSSEILRFSTAFSQNPTIYEISENIDWFSFEKAIFSARLEAGSLEKYTQNIEENLKLYCQQAIKEIIFVSTDEISDIIKSFFSPTNIDIKILEEELNLTQFKKFPDHNFNNNCTSLTVYNIGFVKLDAKILEDKHGKSIKKIQEGETVLSTITDQRDIAHYLVHLIGGKENGIISPIPATIQKVYYKNENFEVHLYYASSITGFAIVQKNSKLKVLDEKQVWWGKILPW